MRILFLGDIHRNFNLILQYVKLYDITDAHIIQVGDFGVGFKTFIKEKRALELIHTGLVKRNVHVWAIRGNHDYKPYFDADPFGFSNIHLVADYSVLNLADKNILCIGGAVSVDRLLNATKNQKEGIFEHIIGRERWWPDEVFVLDTERLQAFRNINIVVTHTAPDYVTPDNRLGLGLFVNSIIKETGDEALRTDLLFERNQLTNAFNILKLNNNIENHYYGHFHKSDCCVNHNTTHRLLGIGELWEERE